MTSRVNIYEELYDNLIEDRGHWAEWSRAAVCSCVSRDSGQPDFMCPICGGGGYRYMKPQRIKLAVTSMSGQIETKTLELREPGMAYVTPKSDVVMGYQDMLRFPDFTCLFSEVIHWDKAADGYGVSPRTYRNMKSVVSLTDTEYEYFEGTDFEITEDGYHLRWLDKRHARKLDGRNMSLLYTTTPSYLVIDLLHELRATLSDRNSNGEVTFRELPKQYKVQRQDFIYSVAEPEPVADTVESTLSLEPEPIDEQPARTPIVSTIYDSDGGITIE